MFIRALILAFLSPILLSACAYVTAVPAPPGSDARGIRVPDIKPLLVVTGGQVEVVTVPNPNRAYAVQFGSFLAKHNLEAQFSNGFINSIKSDQDTTAFSIELLKALTEATKAGVAISDGFSADGGSGEANDLQVYDIVFDDLGNLVALKPLIQKHSTKPFTTQAFSQPQAAAVVPAVSADKGAEDLIDIN